MIVGSSREFNSLSLSTLTDKVYVIDTEASQRVEKTEGTSKRLLGSPGNLILQHYQHLQSYTDKVYIFNAEASQEIKKTEVTSKRRLGSPSEFSSLALSTLRDKVYIFDAEASPRVEKTEGTSKRLLGLPVSLTIQYLQARYIFSMLK